MILIFNWSLSHIYMKVIPTSIPCATPAEQDDILATTSRLLGLVCGGNFESWDHYFLDCMHQAVEGHNFRPVNRSINLLFCGYLTTLLVHLA
jgi:hypothetical protein